MSAERLVVVGAGAIGGGIGALCAERGGDVLLVARGAHGDALRARGLVLRMPDRTLRVAPPCAASIGEVGWRAGDVALLAVKLQDAEAALDALLAAAGRDVPVVCATNGVHAERWASARFSTVLSIVVWMPATHLVPGQVELFAAPCRGVLDLGRARGDDRGLATRLAARLCDAGFDSRALPDVARWKRAKWVSNLGNAAQALVEDDPARVAAAARAEGERVLDAAGLDRVPTPDLLARVDHVRAIPIDGREREGGSTWQSRARGRPLETPYLEGAIAELAAELGVPAPVNAFLARAAREGVAVRAADVPGL